MPLHYCFLDWNFFNKCNLSPLFFFSTTKTLANLLSIGCKWCPLSLFFAESLQDLSSRRLGCGQHIRSPFLILELSAYHMLTSKFLEYNCQSFCTWFRNIGIFVFISLPHVFELKETKHQVLVSQENHAQQCFPSGWHDILFLIWWKVLTKFSFQNLYEIIS